MFYIREYSQLKQNRPTDDLYVNIVVLEEIQKDLQPIVQIFNQKYLENLFFL